ncbi:hypothetical protein R70199_06948 [Paraburkholderia domus]|nr:hypothetical protein R70199_06948 [Paraburkholderia domus]
MNGLQRRELSQQCTNTTATAAATTFTSKTLLLLLHRTPAHPFSRASRAEFGTRHLQRRGSAAWRGLVKVTETVASDTAPLRVILGRRSASRRRAACRTSRRALCGEAQRRCRRKYSRLAMESEGYNSWSYCPLHLRTSAEEGVQVPPTQLKSVTWVWPRRPEPTRLGQCHVTLQTTSVRRLSSPSGTHRLDSRPQAYTPSPCDGASASHRPTPCAAPGSPFGGNRLRLPCMAGRGLAAGPARQRGCYQPGWCA